MEMARMALRARARRGGTLTTGRRCCAVRAPRPPDAAGCDAVVRDVERAATRRGGWMNARHAHAATRDLPLHAGVPARRYAALRALLDGVVLPAMRARYATRRLRVKEAFVVKYEAGLSSAGLEMHRDGTLLNCVILLSCPADFEGGGTAFAPPLGRTWTTAQGAGLCSCGQLSHGAAVVTKGVRYTLIAFIDEEQEVEEEEGRGILSTSHLIAPHVLADGADAMIASVAAPLLSWTLASLRRDAGPLVLSWRRRLPHGALPLRLVSTRPPMQPARTPAARQRRPARRRRARRRADDVLHRRQRQRQFRASTVGSGALLRHAVLSAASASGAARRLGYGVSGTIRKGVADTDSAVCWACGYCDSKMSVYNVGMLGALIGATFFLLLATLSSCRCRPPRDRRRRRRHDACRHARRRPQLGRAGFGDHRRGDPPPLSGVIGVAFARAGSAWRCVAPTRSALSRCFLTGMAQHVRRGWLVLLPSKPARPPAADHARHRRRPRRRRRRRRPSPSSRASGGPPTRAARPRGGGGELTAASSAAAAAAVGEVGSAAAAPRPTRRRPIGSRPPPPRPPPPRPPPRWRSAARLGGGRRGARLPQSARLRRFPPELCARRQRHGERDVGVRRRVGGALVRAVRVLVDRDAVVDHVGRRRVCRPRRQRDGVARDRHDRLRPRAVGLCEGVHDRVRQTLTVVVATVRGMPVSSTHCKVGTVVCGRARGQQARQRQVNAALLGKIVASWVLTLLAGGVARRSPFCSRRHHSVGR